MLNTVQGKDAILSFLKDDYMPFMCASDIAISIDVDERQVRTTGDGAFKKTEYQAVGYSMTLSGVLVFDSLNMDTWQMISNQLSFIKMPFRLSFKDSTSPFANIKTVQGTVILKSTQLSGKVGDVVKGTFSMSGNGSLFIFDGLDPCPTQVTAINMTGLTGSTGIVNFTFTFTGDVYQIKYRFDGAGDYSYALTGQSIAVPFVTGIHSIEAIPVCSNDFEGVGLTQSFTVTQNNSCLSVIGSITIDLANKQATSAGRSGAATLMRVSIDGGTISTLPITQSVSLSGLTPGNHSITMTPVCVFGAQQLAGIGFTQAFTIATTPSQSVINYTMLLNRSGPIFAGANFRIYVDGNLVIADSGNDSAAINVRIGALIRCEVNITPFGTPGPAEATLQVVDQSSTITLNSSNGSAITGLTFSFTANGDTYSITETISM